MSDDAGARAALSRKPSKRLSTTESAALDRSGQATRPAPEPDETPVATGSAEAAADVVSSANARAIRAWADSPGIFVPVPVIDEDPACSWATHWMVANICTQTGAIHRCSVLNMAHAALTITHNSKLSFHIEPNQNVVPCCMVFPKVMDIIVVTERKLLANADINAINLHARQKVTRWERFAHETVLACWREAYDREFARTRDGSGVPPAVAASHPCCIS